MYKATIEDKKITNGMLSVTVKFGNEETGDSVKELFQTNQEQTSVWLEDHVARKLKDLNSLKDTETKIEVGTEVIPKEETIEEKVLISKEKLEYKTDLEKFNKMVGITQQGLLSREDAGFLELKEKLKTNFSPDYLDLF